MNLAALWPIPSQALPEIYPAQIGHLLLDSYQEVLGQPGFQSALRKAGLEIPTAGISGSQADLPFEAPALIAQAVEEIYGEQVGRGLCLRTGRAMFRRGVRQFSRVLGLTDRGFRLLPPAQKILRGIDLLAWMLNHYSGQRVRVEKTGHYLMLINEHCPHCWGFSRASACCSLPVGALQEGLAWADGGKRHTVEEIACHAKGDPACTYRLSRKPL